MKTRLRLMPLLLAVGSALGLSSCSDIKSPTFQGDLERIEVCEARLDGSCPGDDGSRCTSANATIPVGENRRFCAVGVFSGLDNSEVFIPQKTANLTASVDWSSSNPGALSVDEVGNARALQESASVQVTASRGDISGSALAQVRPAEVKSLTIRDSEGRTGPFETIPELVENYRCIANFAVTVSCGDGVNSSSCDRTQAADWQSADPGIFSINNSDAKGRGTAVSVGSTAFSCALNVNPPVAPAQVGITVCDAELQTLRIAPSGPLTLITGEERNDLQLLGDFEGDCGDGVETFTRDLTLAADWSSDRPDVIAVDNDPSDGDRGGLTGGDTFGLAVISAEFQGQPVTINVFNRDGSIVEVRVDGPEFVFSGFTHQYTAVPVFLDDETGELVEGEDVSASNDIVWTSSLPEQVGFPMNDGLAFIAENAVAQPVEIQAIYQGVTGRLDTEVVEAEVQDVQVLPSQACISNDLLGQGLVATQRQYNAEAILEITRAGSDPVQCAQTATEASEWSIEPGNCALNLLPAFESATVSNVPGMRGLVTSIPQTLGSNCVSAEFRGFVGQGDVLVVEDVLTGVCNALEPILNPILTTLLGGGDEPAPQCVEALAPPPDGANDSARR